MTATKSADEVTRFGPRQQGRNLPSPLAQVETEPQRRRRLDGGPSVLLFFASRFQNLACGTVPAHSTPVHDGDL